jgi:hypothetical protein
MRKSQRPLTPMFEKLATGKFDNERDITFADGDKTPI